MQFRLGYSHSSKARSKICHNQNPKPNPSTPGNVSDTTAILIAIIFTTIVVGCTIRKSYDYRDDYDHYYHDFYHVCYHSTLALLS